MNKKVDPVKKIFGKTAEELITEAQKSAIKKADHETYHSKNAFCGYAGPEEMKHFYWLLSKLSDKQIRVLANNVKLKFLAGNENVDRESIESAIDETDRELFYREYHKIIKSQ